MSILDAQFRTVTCNGTGCDKTVTFNQKDSQNVVNDNPWLQSVRVIQTADGRNLCYCSDVCEVNNVSSGAHNPPQAKKIIEMPTAGSDAVVRAAALAAAQAEEATRALKAGTPVTLS